MALYVVIRLIHDEGPKLVADNSIKDCFCLNFCCAAEIGSKVSESGEKGNLQPLTVLAIVLRGDSSSAPDLILEK